MHSPPTPRLSPSSLSRGWISSFPRPGESPLFSPLAWFMISHFLKGTLSGISPVWIGSPLRSRFLPFFLRELKCSFYIVGRFPLISVPLHSRSRRQILFPFFPGRKGFFLPSEGLRTACFFSLGRGLPISKKIAGHFPRRKILFFLLHCPWLFSLPQSTVTLSLLFDRPSSQKRRFSRKGLSTS